MRSSMASSPMFYTLLTMRKAADVQQWDVLKTVYDRIKSA
ncbi:hypothetical protein JCM19239_5431 [Vibrio variabilis]|uniref:Uncharacterized protein n=1 Tax=Vibrio variabilis TaxID=990271 RepID=A0ABQ0JHE0_9VIBR|nr:hypothetical protein JCM19239_5431 [Vibrio variabilis]